MSNQYITPDNQGTIGGLQASYTTFAAMLLVLFNLL